MSAVFVQITKSGEIIKDTTFLKQDTSFFFQFGFIKPNGNYFLIGGVSDTVSPLKYNSTYVCEMKPNLEYLWEKVYPLPFSSPYSNHQIMNFMITPDSCIVIQGVIDTIQYSTQDNLFLSKYNVNGDQLCFQYFPTWTDFTIGGGSDLLLKPDSTGFYYIGEVNLNYSPKDWIEFDFLLNITLYGNIEDILSGFYTPASVKRLSNGNLIAANHSIGMYNNPYHELEMRVIDQDFNLIRDTILYHDEYVCIPDHRGMDFINEDNIWVATFENTPPSFSGTDVFRIFIFDSELYLKGTKEYGGDTRYWFQDLLATTDGGCLMTGLVPKFPGSNSCDSYVIKVMPEDILTSVDNNLEGKNENVIQIFPNPFSDYLHIKGTSKRTKINLFDQTGRLVIKSEINETSNMIINTGNLPAGFYYYQAFNNSDFIQNGKLLKLRN